MPASPPGLVSVAVRELRWMWHDRVALFLAVGVPLLAFAVLSLTFSNAVVRDLRVDVVDRDHTQTSMIYVQALNAAPGVAVTRRSTDLNAAMHAVRLHQFGPAENLRYEEVDAPAPGPGEVRVAVAASGVHLIDTRLRAGEQMGPLPLPTLPAIPGREVAGTVDAVAGDVDPFTAVVEVWNPAKFDEIVVSTLPASTSRWMHAGLPRRIERHTGALVRHVETREALVAPAQRPLVGGRT